MKRRITSLLLLVLMLVGLSAHAQSAEGGTYQKPNVQDRTLYQRIQEIYGFDQQPFDGSGQTIAIIGALHDYEERAAQDLLEFIQGSGTRMMHGLPGTEPCTVALGPHPCFEVIKAPGATDHPPLFWDACTTWIIENAMDVQMAHHAAPGADILLVLGRTPGFYDMNEAVKVAHARDVPIISMSFGANESDSEYLAEFMYQANNLFAASSALHIASAGDSGGVRFPATSPHVLAIGGTSFFKDNSWLPGQYERADGAGGTVGTPGGPSRFFAAPAHQQTMGFAMRTVPDLSITSGSLLSFFASGATITSDLEFAQTGRRVKFNTGGWRSAGGTSEGAPRIAGMVALANQARATVGKGPITSTQPFYEAGQGQVYFQNYRDITDGQGSCNSEACAARRGFDIATGFGVPRVENLVPYLAGISNYYATDIRVSTTDPGSVTVTWRTVRPTSSHVCVGRPDVGTGGPFERCLSPNPGLRQRHTVTLRGVAPGKQIALVVQSADRNGLTVTSRPIKWSMPGRPIASCPSYDCAKLLPLGQQISARITRDYGMQVGLVPMIQGQTYVVTVKLERGSLYIASASRQIIASRGVHKQVEMTFTPAVTGTYFVMVQTQRGPDSINLSVSEGGQGGFNATIEVWAEVCAGWACTTGWSDPVRPW